MGVAVADKAAAILGCKYCGFEDPEVFLRAAERKHRFRHNATAMLALRKPKQIAVRDEPDWRTAPNSTFVLRIAVVLLPLEIRIQLAGRRHKFLPCACFMVSKRI